MLRLSNVSKVYRVRRGTSLRPRVTELKALDEVSLDIPDGETVAVIGPNGAGKSTLCKVVTGIVKPTSGTAELDGQDITKDTLSVSRRIGFVFGSTLTYHRLTGYDYLKFFSSIYGVRDEESRIREVSSALGLEDWLRNYIEAYSLGMKVKVSLARALLHDPPFLVLDEFTMGLDPLAAREIRKMVSNMNKTVLLTTHNTVEAQAMADRIAFLSKGRVAVFDTIENMERSIEPRKRVSAVVAEVAGAKAELRRMGGVMLLEGEEGTVEFYVHEDDLARTIQVLAKYGVRDVRTLTPTIEDAYAHFTGDQLHEK
jgi:ABC-2 type transport system ATP-binding protein